MDKYVGKRLDGRYELQELIGVGGMATVYKAYDTIDDKIVAVKILKEEFLGNDDFIRRFKNESKAIAVLSHILSSSIILPVMNCRCLSTRHTEGMVLAACS